MSDRSDLDPMTQTLLEMADRPPEYAECWYADLIPVGSTSADEPADDAAPSEPPGHLAFCCTADGVSAFCRRRATTPDVELDDLLVLLTMKALVESEGINYRPGTLKIYADGLAERLGRRLAPLGIFVERGRNVLPEAVGVALAKALEGAFPRR